jgi:hypothetical protein
MNVSLKQQIKCVEREIAMRKQVYPRWVNINKLSQQKADEELAAMEAVERSLRLVRDMVQTMDRERRRALYEELSKLDVREYIQPSLLPDDAPGSGYGKGGL